MANGSAEELRASGLFSVEAGLGITTAETTVTPYRLSNDDAIKIPKGGDWRYPVTWYQEGDSPADLTAASATFTVRTEPSGGTLLLALTEGAGITLGSGQGNVLMALGTAATAALTFARGWAQLTVLKSGRALRLFEGFCDVVS